MKHNAFFAFYVGMCLVVATSVNAASGFQTIVKDGQSEKRSQSEAKREIFENVTNELALEYIKRVIGNDRYDQHKSVVASSILKKKDRFFPVVKGGTPVRTAGVTSMTVTVKFSFDDLKSILRSEGLLNPQEGPGTVLPMFFVLNEVESQSYKWWYGETGASIGFSKKQLNTVIGSLSKSFTAKGFYVLNPVEWNMSEWVVPAIRKDSYRKRDYMSVGEYLGAQIVLTGMLRFFKDQERINRNMVEYRLTATHTGNGRIVAEVIRKFPTDAGSFQTVVTKKIADSVEEISGELASQTFSAWQEGALGSRRVKLSLVGTLSYEELESFKEHVNRKYAEIRNIRERLLENRRATFELDSDSSPRSLATRLKGSKFSGLTLVDPDVSTSEVTFKVRRSR